MPLYLTIREGPSPITATAILATADSRVIRAALRELGKLGGHADRAEGDEDAEDDEPCRFAFEGTHEQVIRLTQFARLLVASDDDDDDEIPT